MSSSEQDTLLQDRRWALRQPTGEIPLIVEHHQLGRHEGIVLDVSRKGLRFRADFCFPCGSMILLHPPAGSDLRAVRGRIMREQLVERNGEMVFECGVQYTDEAEIRRHTWFLKLRESARSSEAAA
jgi:hypothetical protein